MPNPKLTDIEFTLEWKSAFAEHADIYHVQKVDIQNDTLPLNFSEQIAALKVGENISQTFQAKNLLDEDFSNNNVISFQPDLFDTEFKGHHSPPILYRFYPSAIAYQGLDVHEKDYRPFRLISVNSDNMVADRNHPLAKYYLTLNAKKIQEFVGQKSNDRRKRNVSKLITARGPGMQAPFEYGDAVFFDQYPFDKKDKPQLENPALDSNASEQIAKLYSQLLPKYSKILDLMSGESSYLAADYETGLLTGIGTNEGALSKNMRLDTYQTQDLNLEATLPFETNSFDDAICSLAIENLTDPLQIIKEVARVVTAGGKFIITFSDRSTSANPIKLWGQLHPFERMQLVLEYFRKTALFEELNTLSIRGLAPDKSSSNNNNKRPSNSLYSIWGTVK